MGRRRVQLVNGEQRTRLLEQRAGKGRGRGEERGEEGDGVAGWAVVERHEHCDQRGGGDAMITSQRLSILRRWCAEQEQRSITAATP